VQVLRISGDADAGIVNEHRPPLRGQTKQSVRQEVKKILPQARVANRRNPGQDEEDRADRVDEISKAAEIVRAGKQILRPLPESQTAFGR
jgi:hypothetical protein